MTTAPRTAHIPARLAASALALLAASALSPSALAQSPPPTTAGQVDAAQLEAPVREAIATAQREVDTLRRAGASEANLARAWGDLGMVYHAHDLMAPALAAYREAARFSPERADWHYLLAVTAQATGAAGDALMHLTRSLALEPGYAPTLIRRGRVHVAQGRFAEAEQDFRAAIALEPEDAAAHAELGRVLAQRGRHADALEHLERALALQPGADQLHYNLGQSHRALGNVEQARTHLEQRGERQPRMRDPLTASVMRLSRSAQNYYELAMQQLLAGNHDNAEVAFARAAELDPRHAVYARMHATQLARQGKLEAARAEARRAAALEPGAEAQLLLGRLSEIDGDDHAAIAAYETALRLQPDHVAARDLLARANTRLRRFDVAAAHYSALARNDEQRAYALYRGGLLDLVQGRCDAAREALQAALSASGGRDGWVLLALARTDAVCGGGRRDALATALLRAQQVYEARPGVESAETLAMVLASNGRHADAVELQMQAIFEALKGPAGQQELQRRPELQANLQRYRDGQPAAAALTLADPLLAHERLTVERLREGVDEAR